MTLRRVLSIYCVAVLVFGTVGRAQHAYRQLREFGFREQAASEPLSGVVVGPQGWIYGTSRGGHGGLIYRVKNDGSEFSIVYEFESTIFPSNGRLIVGSDGKLYGTAILGNGLDGAVYRIQPDGSGFQVYALPSEARTISGVIEGSDGRLYGTTLGGGVNEAGTVFGINKDGSGFATLHGFNVSDGYQPGADPLEGSDGRLYLTTRGGGSGNAGVVCALNKNGTGFVVLHHFSGTGTNDGRFPNGGLVQGPAGYLYGTTDSGGIGGDEDFFAGFGVVYRLLTDGDGYSIVRRFEGDVNDGHRPKDVFVASDGLLYGTSQNASYAKNVDGLFRMQTTGGAFQFVFTWVTDDNQTIRLNRIIESGDGNFYGSSAAGGASNAGQVFKLEPNGTHYQTLHEFSIVGGDGSSPSTLIMDGDGTLYGTTLGGGENDKGTIYKLEANGNYSLLHSFEPQSGVPLGLIAASDGFLYGSAYHSRDLFRLSKDGHDYTVIINLPESPAGQLVEGSDFLLYGVTEPGSVFRLNPDGTDFGIIHTITNITGEAVFPAGIVEASDGKLYGTATRGGSSNQGMVFKMNKDGGQYEVVYSFVAPTGTLVFPNPLCEASDGYLYGTTYRGGGDSEGIIYRINKTAGYEFVTAFRENRGNPIGKLAEGPDGWMYGVTQESGDFGGGILFRFKLGSTAAYVLYHFGADGQGADPAAGVVTGSAGEIYGTTQYGGFGGGFGTVFRVDMNPVLSILRAGANAQVSWPLDGERYELQTTTNLASPWQFFSTGITNFPERVSATAPLGTGAHFYRLQKSP